MEKPYVVCHMLTSLDGKIDGAFFTSPDSLPALREYGKLRETLDCQATLYGTTTMLGGYAKGRVGTLTQSAEKLPREDHLAPSSVQNYLVSLDPQGVLAFEGATSSRKGRPEAHIIEVLTDKASNAYLAYLRSMGISYVFAGKELFDCTLLLHKLKTLFGIERLMIAGGGVTNWSFAAEGLIDELSVVIAPVADGGTEAASIFETSDGQKRAPTSFILKETKALLGDSVWLRYIKK